MDIEKCKDTYCEIKCTLKNDDMFNKHGELCEQCPMKGFFNFYNSMVKLELKDNNPSEFCIKDNKITLYGANTSCQCGCRTETHIFLTLEEALKFSSVFNTKVKVIEMDNCEDIGESRFIFDNLVVGLGCNKVDIDGNRVIRFFNVTTICR